MTAGKHPKDTAPQNDKPKKQMHKGRQLAAFDWRTLTRLTLRELLAPTRFVQTDFLPFNFTRIARNEASFRQRRLQCGIVFDQSAGNTVTHGACLTRLTTARHVNLDVKPRNLINKLQRLTNDHAPGHPRKELIDRLAVDNNSARTTLHEYASNRAFATARTVVKITSHFDPLDFQNFGLLDRKSVV